MRSKSLLCVLAPLLWLVMSPASAAPPSWLRELAAAPVPAQKPDVDAVQLLHEVSLKVMPDGRQRRQVRRAFRLLRQSGEARVALGVPYNHWIRVRDMQGWSVPASGKPVEVRFKDAVETSIMGVADSTLVSDARVKILRIPGVRAGDTVGYEFETEENGLELADHFSFQDTIPVLKASYALELPAGWTVTSAWARFAAVQPVNDKPQRWLWTLQNLPPIVRESHMPSPRGVAGSLYLAFSASSAPAPLASWSGIGTWYTKLVQDRRAATPEIRAKVAELIAGKPTPQERVQALAAFVQKDIRYVAIELGIGGYQPHAASEVFANRFGDCKDKSNLLGVMLAEAGIESELVLINTDRVEVAADTPPGLQRFNHVILAVRLPAGMPTAGLLPVIDAPGGGRLLFFDPTDEVTPVGRLPGELQGAFGLLATGENARLLQLPRVSPVDSGLRRTATLKLDEQGMLAGQVAELFVGDAARRQRYALRTITKDADMVKPLEKRLAGSLARFSIDSASLRNRSAIHEPLEWHYSLHAAGYASRAGDLLMVRPRVIGVLAEDLSEQEDARVHDLSFSEVRADEDVVTIELPAGYVVDSLPEPVDIDVGFAAYRSRVEVAGSRLRYTRRYELRELQVPAAKFEDFRRLQRAIARDERASAVLKSATK